LAQIYQNEHQARGSSEPAVTANFSWEVFPVGELDRLGE